MKVILLKDVNKIGKRYEIKEVADGFARNYLLPGNLVKMATKENLEWLKKEKEKEEKAAEEELIKIGKLVSQIEGEEIEIPVKIGDKGQLFEKITQQKIAKRMKEMGYDVCYSQIELSQPIEELGEFPVKVKFSHNLEADVTVIIIEETI